MKPKNTNWHEYSYFTSFTFQSWHLLKWFLAISASTQLALTHLSAWWGYTFWKSSIPVSDFCNIEYVKKLNKYEVHKSFSAEWSRQNYMVTLMLQKRSLQSYYFKIIFTLKKKRYTCSSVCLYWPTLFSSKFCKTRKKLFTYNISAWLADTCERWMPWFDCVSFWIIHDHFNLSFYQLWLMLAFIEHAAFNFSSSFKA